VKKLRSSSAGFTLMEMLIVLSIIALLMGMVIYNLTGVNEVAQQQKVQSDLLSFKELLITFKADLKAAEVEFINAQGQRADFHSLRHTLATNLARAGTSPRIAMEIMRHSDIKLTTKTYTDAGLLPVSDAVINLPSLLAAKAPSTQIGTQSLFRAGPDLSTPDTELDDNELLEVPGIKRLEREDSALVLTGHENEESCRARTRT
jgi:prepilin-type N-terminal cleavage/methylation domain-containing protein